MVARPDGDAGIGQNGGDIVGMHIVYGKGKDAVVLLRGVRAQKMDVGDLFYAFQHEGGEILFPLPDAAQAARLSGYEIQLVPFQFVADFLRETPLVLSDARTYLPALFDRTVLQVVCNILMLLPFGMYLRYVCGLDLGKVALASLAFSAFIELGQLTGLFFVFRGSYRLCDVDDLMLNTLGGLLGGELVHALEAYLPPLDAFDRFPGSSALAMQRLG